MPRPDAEAPRIVEDGEGGVHRRPVEERLAHPHEDDVGRAPRRDSRSTISRTWPAISNGVRLRRNPMRPVAQKEQRSAQPGLGRNAEGSAGPGGDEHRLDGLAVGQAPEVLPGPVYRLLDDLRRQPGEGESPVQLGPEGRGSSVASAQRATGDCHSRRSSWAARYDGAIPARLPRPRDAPGRPRA